MSAASGYYRPLRVRVLRRVLRVEAPEDAHSAEVHSLGRLFELWSAAVEAVIRGAPDVEREVGDMLTIYSEDRVDKMATRLRPPLLALGRDLSALLSCIEDDTLTIKSSALQADRQARRTLA